MNYQDFKAAVLPYMAIRVGVMLSGGYDSAVLLGALQKVKQDEGLDTVINTYTVGVGVDDGTRAANIASHFGVSHTMLTPLEGSPDDKVVYFALTQPIANNDYVFTGDTDFTPEAGHGTPPARLPADSGSTVVQPFFSVYKDTVVAIADELDLGDVVSLTNSCIVSDPACGECWWCRERAWATE